MAERTWFLIKNQDDTWTLTLTAENQALPSPDDPYLIVTQQELHALARVLAQHEQETHVQHTIGELDYEEP